MKVYHVEFAKVGTGLSGGEKCMIEIIKYFKKRGIINVLLTTDNGRATYEGLGLVEDEFLSYFTIESYQTEKYSVFISYVMRLFFFKTIRSEIINSIDYKTDVLMCHSDFFPNTIVTSLLSKCFGKKIYWWFHMRAPHLFRGYEGEYTGRWHLPNLRIAHYILNQKLFLYFSKKGVTITVNPIYNELLRKRNSYTLHKFGGESVYIIKKHSGVKTPKIAGEKKYDLIFLGRFHPQKGLFELPKILALLKKDRPDVRLAIVGGGAKKIQDKLFNLINKTGLSDNVEYLGFISSDKKYDYMLQSKVFIFPSYYESFGQVALEAMSCGIPVVAYDLPVFSVFEKGMRKVPVLDNVAFANEIRELLLNDSLYQKASSEASEYASTFSWEKTGEEIYQLVVHA